MPWGLGTHKNPPRDSVPTSSNPKAITAAQTTPPLPSAILKSFPSLLSLFNAFCKFSSIFLVSVGEGKGIAEICILHIPICRWTITPLFAEKCEKISMLLFRKFELLIVFYSFVLCFAFMFETWGTEGRKWLDYPQFGIFKKIFDSPWSVKKTKKIPCKARVSVPSGGTPCVMHEVTLRSD